MNDKFLERDAFKCLICKTTLFCEWTDRHGEGACLKCGAPYQLIQRDESQKVLDVDPSINVSDEYLPYLSRYWVETSRHMGLGDFLGPPKNPKGRNAFFDWLENENPPTNTAPATARDDGEEGG